MFSPDDQPPRSLPIDRNRELLKSATGEIYKEVNGQPLHVYIWYPDPAHDPHVPRSVGAFFFSSGWDNGQVSQFAPHCVYLASRGMVTMAFDYRVGARFDGAGPLEAMADARTALRWIRYNAVQLNINPNKIVGVGGSCGAHAITAAALLPETFSDSTDPKDILAAPNALVLFNPVLETTGKTGFGAERFASAAEAKNASLVRAIRAGLPPSLIMHGTADRVVNCAGSAAFAKQANKKKNFCRYIEFEGQGHGWFNFNLSFEMYEATLVAMDEFLVEQGYISPDPDAQLGKGLI
jgi:acetyl esterase/lipase